MPEPDMSLMRRLKERGKVAGGGDGSDDGGMLEQRVAHLERDMGEVKASLGRIEAVLSKFEGRFDKMDGRFEKADERLRKLELDVAGMKERLALMPTTWTTLGLIVAMTGLVLAVLRFGPRL
ncbi:MAG: hypothetical protein MUC64_05120 [Rubritepida sp.]|jgi:predicted nuclease with TOPRIM domain|nr:hypothetical protein [Rubritepida sp.]